MGFNSAFKGLINPARHRTVTPASQPKGDSCAGSNYVYSAPPPKKKHIFPRILLGRTNKSTIPTVVCVLLRVLVASKITGT